MYLYPTCNTSSERRADDMEARDVVASSVLLLPLHRLHHVLQAQDLSRLGPHVVDHPERPGILPMTPQPRLLAEWPARYPSVIELKVIASSPCSHPALNLGTWITSVNHRISVRIHQTLTYCVVQDAIPRINMVRTSQIWFREFSGHTSS
jgi:hypothetical protein